LTEELLDRRDSRIEVFPDEWMTDHIGHGVRCRLVLPRNDSCVGLAGKGVGRACYTQDRQPGQGGAAALEQRAGLHSGECVFDRECGRGRAIDVAANLAISAANGEVLVSQTVTDLVTATDLAFRERGVRQFAGEDAAWPLYEASMR
jgi:hypothetical protein